MKKSRNFPKKLLIEIPPLDLLAPPPLELPEMDGALKAMEAWIETHMEGVFEEWEVWLGNLGR